MPQFTFKLGAVLRARQRVEQEKQRALAELQRERIALEDVLRLHQQRIEESRGAMRDSLQGSVNTRDLRNHAAATMRLMARAQNLALELANVHRRIETARAQLLEASRDRRAIELLRDQRFEKWRREEQRAEARSLDELAVAASARQRDGAATC